MNAPKYTVILPVCHGGIFLQRALKSLASLSSPRGGFEVVVAGKEKMINPAASEISDARWRFVVCNGNRSEALNAACSAARGMFWVFTDDDCIVSSDWLIDIERELAGCPEVSVLGGFDVLAPGGNDFDMALDVVLNSWMGTGGIRANRLIKTGRYYPKLWNMIVSAEAANDAAIHNAGIFDPALPVHEDVDLVDRIKAQGGKVCYAPSVRVEHSRDTSFKSFFLRNIAMAGVCRKAGVHRAAHLAMPVFFAGLALLGGAFLVFPGVTLLFFLAGGAYLAAAVFTGILGSWRKKRLVLLGVVPVLIFSLHFARTLGYVFPFRRRRGEIP